MKNTRPSALSYLLPAVGLLATIATACGPSVMVVAGRQIRCPSGTRLEGQGPPHGDEITCLNRTEQGQQQRHGMHVRWHSNGNVERLEEYQYGRLHGRSLHYHPDGQRAIDGRYENGQRVGIWFYWDEQGGRRMVNYSKAGRVATTVLRVSPRPRVRPRTEPIAARPRPRPRVTPRPRPRPRVTPRPIAVRVNCNKPPPKVRCCADARPICRACQRRNKLMWGAYRQQCRSVAVRPRPRPRVTPRPRPRVTPRPVAVRVDCRKPMPRVSCCKARLPHCFACLRRGRATIAAYRAKCKSVAVAPRPRPRVTPRERPRPRPRVTPRPRPRPRVAATGPCTAKFAAGTKYGWRVLAGAKVHSKGWLQLTKVKPTLFRVTRVSDTGQRQVGWVRWNGVLFLYKAGNVVVRAWRAACRGPVIQGPQTAGGRAFGNFELDTSDVR